ncbi:sigma-70 family RNA polymerase sigma factor [Streptomyces flavofungini]|uniref:Sigma-70 family RNA polymerase sigma factor n=1 Tax=Streptomyces flavofungini TaxID=68200 RepID=A0ABS0WYU2_9ACTN|nr:sigma-70 family RNA polymerase sigma factor [Streptomyces flavofungini]MBJ3806103.1 sigma-70 family RNA polymerase sigma factor [Streptomyces flavofungini]GHC47355.1 DNA-directed RNA polymerase sigma-70 factor [Streptomyces flavofungini]
MDGRDLLAQRFEEHRPRLKAVAYRMLGSLSEAEDAVQETWLKLSRVDDERVENLGGWLTTVVGRVCLDLLRARKQRGEQPLDVQASDTHVPDPEVSPLPGGRDAVDPEQEALLADSVGLALLVVLDTLSPAERLAFVLHDMFAVPFEDIAPIVERAPAATRQLASRARRRVRGSDPAPAPDTDRTRHRQVVEAFLAAARKGDFDALLELLDPGVVLRADGGGAEGLSRLVRGATAVVAGARSFSTLAPTTYLALVNGKVGQIAVHDGRAFSVGEFTVRDGRIVEINILADQERLRELVDERTVAAVTSAGPAAGADAGAGTATDAGADAGTNTADGTSSTADGTPPTAD